MKRETVDFFVVEDKHIPVHTRLLNWARWSHSGGGGSQVSPMFRLYRAPDQEDREDLGRNSIPINALDAADMQKAVCKLPDSQRAAANWNYVRPSNPKRAAIKLGVSQEGLMLLVRSARQMLINRGC